MLKCSSAGVGPALAWSDAVNTTLRRWGRALALLVLPLALAGCGVNAIPTKEEAAKARWADVQSQYQRRADLIPNLVETVRGYAQQERNVLVEVTQARARATSVQVNQDTVTDPAKFQEYARAQNQLSGVLGRLLLIQERYPDLKSNQNFLALQSQLEGTENRIAVARRDYNNAVQDFNTTLRVFPTVLWAKTFYSGSKPMQLFQAAETAQTAPTVDFGTRPAPGVNMTTPAPGAAPPPATTPPPAQPAPTGLPAPAQ